MQRTLRYKSRTRIHPYFFPPCHAQNSILLTMGSLLRLINPEKANFTEVNLERQDGKVVVITGGYSGVGLELAKILLDKGARVYVVSRSQEKGEAMMKEFGKDTLTFIRMDLADLNSIYDCAQKIIELEEKVDVLYNMAGVGFAEGKTVQGYEPHIGINCLGHYFFTQQLLPLLRKSTTTTEKGTTRVIWAGAYYAKSRPKFEKGAILDFVRNSDKGANMEEFGLYKYAISKVVNWYMSLELARREECFRKNDAISLTTNVGPLKTNIWKAAPWYVRFLFYPTLRAPKQGAYTALFAGFDNQVAHQAGKPNDRGEYRYVVPWGHWCSFTPSQYYLDAINSGEAKQVCDWFEERIEQFLASKGESKV